MLLLLYKKLNVFNRNEHHTVVKSAFKKMSVHQMSHNAGSSTQRPLVLPVVYIAQT